MAKSNPEKIIEVRVDMFELMQPAYASEALFRILLKSKGLPLEGTFYPKMKQGWIYERSDDYKNNQTIFKAKQVGD